MLSWIREKFGTVVIGGIISFIAFVFVFYGVFSPKSTRGLHEGAVAGTVNGDPISISEFNRELNRKVEFLKNIAGGKITDEQMKLFRIRESVFQELANRKLMLQEAQHQGLTGSDEEVKERIQEIPAFQKDGKFDLTTYKQVLEANHHTPASFERLVREDVSLQQWQSYFRDRIRVSDDEIKREFLISKDKKNLKYVLLTTETAKSALVIDPSEIQKFLADPAKLNLVKMKFEEGKEKVYKDQKLDAVKDSIARVLIASEKTEQLQKSNLALADQIVKVMTADSASDKKVNDLLKPYNVQVKKTGMVSRNSSFIPGLGDSRDLLADVFSAPAGEQAATQPKKYLMGDRVIVAIVTESEKPDLAQLDTEKNAIYRELMTRKSKGLSQEWMKKISTKAKIETNPAVVGADS